MTNVWPENIQKLRGIAAQLRGYAAETELTTYQRKFESAAAELEEVAEGESRVLTERKLHS